MSNSLIIAGLFGFFVVTDLFLVLPIAAQENHQNLLDKVKQERHIERQRMAQRETRFLREKQNQSQLLADAKAEFESYQQQNNPLKQRTEQNAQIIKELKTQITQRKSEIGDFESVLNQMTRDFALVLELSPVTMQLPARSQQLAELTDNQKGLNLQSMEDLWLAVQEEMTLAAQFSQFDAPVIAEDGTIHTQTVHRFGGFSNYQNGRFLRYVPETQELLAINDTSEQAQVNQRFFMAEEQYQTLYVDPTNGSLLGILEWTPDLRERLDQGGIIGKIILALGAIGVIIIIWRALALGWQNQVIRGQLANLHTPKSNNPLGRILIKVKEHTSAMDLSQSHQLDMLQLQVDEAVLNEVGGVERGQNLLKLLAATAPLLGLLGTVTGMIVTFQSISFFGSGDPKLMAGGISQALVTTVLGLIVAIPLLFGHSFVSSLGENIIRRLEEQTAGLLAQLVEQELAAKLPVDNR